MEGVTETWNPPQKKKKPNELESQPRGSGGSEEEEQKSHTPAGKSVSPRTVPGGGFKAVGIFLIGKPVEQLRIFSKQQMGKEDAHLGMKAPEVPTCR